MTIETRILELLSRWEHLRAGGKTVTPEELCGDCPELLDEVRRRIEQLQGFNTLPGSTESERGSNSLPAGNSAESSTAAGLAEGTAASGRYRPLRLHARGGLGEVFVAHDEELRREVALKRIQPRHGDDPESRRRFLLEAEITGRLEHPGVVPVHGLGQDAEGRPCYAMRFIQGETLQEALERFHGADQDARDPGERSLAFRQLLGRFIAVCNTVAYAHSRGILHRDLKPANILLGRYGETLVADWGLARPFERDAAARTTGEQTLTPTTGGTESGTEVGQAVGTPAYMSPEQAAGQWDAVGPASDIYSLGATLYAVLTGRPPFRGDIAEVVSRVKRGDFPPPRQRKKDVPVALEAICLKAMAREPEDRYASPRALADDIERWLAGEPGAAWRDPFWVQARRWFARHRLPLVTAALLVLLVATILSVNARLIMPGRWFTLSTLAALIALAGGMVPLILALRRAQDVRALNKHERDRAKRERDLFARMVQQCLAHGYTRADQLAADPDLAAVCSREDLRAAINNLTIASPSVEPGQENGSLRINNSTQAGDDPVPARPQAAGARPSAGSGRP